MGTSIFAVVNPIWAYCKKECTFPDRVFILYSENDKRIINYLEKTMNYLINILMIYSNKQFNVKNLKVCPFEREDIDFYETKLKEVIIKEIKSNPDKIILDMTPGRKYMSALMMLYGIKDFKTNIPFEVLYLHLYDEQFFNSPYPLIPIRENKFINIFNYRRNFIQDLKIKTNQENFQSGVNLIRIFENDFIEQIDILELIKLFLTILKLKPEDIYLTELIDHYKSNLELLNKDIIEAGSIDQFIMNSGILSEFTNNPEILEQCFNVLLDEFLILLAIFLKNETTNKIRNFSAIKGISLNKKDIRNYFKEFMRNNIIISKKTKRNNQEIELYKLTKKGTELLIMLINLFLQL